MKHSDLEVQTDRGEEARLAPVEGVDEHLSSSLASSRP
jgi:hypothetical protein